MVRPAFSSSFTPGANGSPTMRTCSRILFSHRGRLATNSSEDFAQNIVRGGLADAGGERDVHRLVFTRVQVP
jgi:hypothetical protein